MQKEKFKITQVPIKDLSPALYNPRIWNKEAISQLKESITKFGLVDPIISVSYRFILASFILLLFCK